MPSGVDSTELSVFKQANHVDFGASCKALTVLLWKYRLQVLSNFSDHVCKELLRIQMSVISGTA